MAGRSFKLRIVATVMVLCAVLVLIPVLISLLTGYERGRLRLPVGNRTPVISLSEQHGLILASDGSLWSWGSDFLGWPVLGFSNASNGSPRLRRIGNDTNWVGISTEASQNIAIKSDGTMWIWGNTWQGPGGRPGVVGVPTLAAPGNDWKQASAAGCGFIALKTDGTLWAWGNNWAGSLGIGLIKGSGTPLQVGSSTNWIKVWAGLLETVGMQSDGSLWYWGENPDPAFAQQTNQIFFPTRISADTNWVDIGFSVNTVLAIKSDGTLWTWGREAHVYTGATNLAQDATPTRLGTNSDWKSIASSTGWWCNGLTKTDGSLWFLDASEGKPNGPRPPYKPVQFRRCEWQQDYVAFAAGAAHAAAPGVHLPIGVVLTCDGEVWTWGMVLGDPLTLKDRAIRTAVKFANLLHIKATNPDPAPIIREKPWQLRNTDSAK